METAAATTTLSTASRGTSSFAILGLLLILPR
jgi:hypothetical protein